MRPLLLLLLLLGWHSTALAFFCFSFAGHARSDSRIDAWTWPPPPPPPQYLSPYRLGYQPPLQAEQSDQLPPIREPKKSPEIIQGYRFRPLEETLNRPSAVTPADWRD